MTTIQRQLSSGKWIDETDEESINQFLDMVLKRETWYAERKGREPMTTRQQVIDFLSSGKTINYDSDWYAALRTKPEPKPVTHPAHERSRGQLWQECEVPGCHNEPVCLNCLRCEKTHCHCNGA